MLKYISEATTVTEKKIDVELVKKYALQKLTQRMTDQAK
jgi:hypothetical protein